jgi:hypothetical protein
MTIAISVGAHNISAAPVILAVLILAAVGYVIWRRSRSRRG